ncbi:MAG: alpha/beta fold hydrolase [Deltaproteobacteria bacterium]|nr:alpha/beta fold hydrolase [Deltaproteobacteria bacterium]
MQILRVSPLTLGVLITSLCLTATSGCGPGVKEPAIDLDSQTSPMATDFSSETDVEARYPTQILPFYMSGKAGTFAGQTGVSINYRVFTVPNEVGAIVLLPGRTEPILKFAETIQDLTRQGFSVYAMDHRGQGASGRMLSNPEIGYVEFFKDYISDVDTFVQTIVRATLHPHLFLLAHSMGGGISGMYLYEHPDVFEAVALSSPMFQINTAPFPAGLAADLSLTDCGFSNGQSYAIGQADFDPAQKFTDAGNDVTRSQARYNVKMQMFADNPTQRLGGVSYHWLCESLTATSHVQTVGGASTTPTLIFKAGNDDIVVTSAADAYCHAASQCQIVTYADAYHEVLSERDPPNTNAMNCFL